MQKCWGAAATSSPLARPARGDGRRRTLRRGRANLIRQGRVAPQQTPGRSGRVGHTRRGTRPAGAQSTNVRAFDGERRQLRGPQTIRGAEGPKQHLSYHCHRTIEWDLPLGILTRGSLQEPRRPHSRSSLPPSSSRCPPPSSLPFGSTSTPPRVRTLPRESARRPP